MNKMKWIMSVAVFAAAFCAMASAEEDEEDMREFGGFVDVPPGGPAMLFVDARSGGDGAVPAHVASTVRGMLKLGAESQTNAIAAGEAPYARAVALRKASKGLLAVLLCTGAADDPALAVYPEERVAVVSAQAATAFAKGAEADKRLIKEIWRGIGFICGAGYDKRKAGVMQPVASPVELDLVEWQVIHPMSLGNMTKFLDKYGVKPSKRVMYKKAVEEGWAPAPTNEYQKAIWDEIHSKTNAPAAK